MHAEAYEGFGWALQASGLDPVQTYDILDIGGQHINGSVHDYFPNSSITTLDLENADILADARYWRSEERFHIVICTEVFEHVADWGAVVLTAKRALHAGGLFLATWASDHRPKHGATGEPLPKRNEWYKNVPVADVEVVLSSLFSKHQTRYQYPPGDGYAWAQV